MKYQWAYLISNGDNMLQHKAHACIEPGYRIRRPGYSPFEHHDTICGMTEQLQARLAGNYESYDFCKKCLRRIEKMEAKQ